MQAIRNIIITKWSRIIANPTKINKYQKLLKQTMYKIKNNTLKSQQNQLNYIKREFTEPLSKLITKKFFVLK